MRPLRLRAAAVSGPLVAAALLTLSAVGSALARSTPPPTPVPPFGSPSPFPTTLVTPPPSTTPPELSAAAAILQDQETGQVLFAIAPRARRPIASLTKIMTAVVVLDSSDPSEVVTVGGDAVAEPGSSLGLVEGEQRSVRELLYALLLQSSNDAAVALADHVAGDIEAFVAMMNATAVAMSLRDTMFESPTGLDDHGYSTAEDLAELTSAALDKPLFARIVRTKFREIPAPSGPGRHIQNRNALLWLYPGATGVKTGFTTPAGHCLVAAAEVNGVSLLAVSLGVPVEPFDDSATLLNYGFAEFRRSTLVSEGTSVAFVEVEGQPVPGVASSTIERFVRVDLLGTVRREFHQLEGLELPITAGDQLGELVISVDGRRIGSVHVLAGRSVTIPVSSPAPQGPVDATPFEEALGVAFVLLRGLAAAFL
jgi:D-alanyl-D-alanine carboxypeptidase (penicillin-binding protein 5/6)